MRQTDRGHHGPPTTGRAEAGVALMTTMMVMLLLSSVLVGFTAMLTSDSRLTTLERGRTEAFYAAHAGLEKLTAQLGNLFAADFTPSGDDVRALTNSPPVLQGVAFTASDGGPGYRISFPSTTGDPATGDPVASNRTIGSGPFQGFIGLLTEYEVDVTARRIDGSESRLQRRLQTASIPVFQFGMFSENDLSFFPGPLFNFGGRVHTNGNLFLAANTGVVLSDRVTVGGEVIRTHLSNGELTTNRLGPIDILTTPGAYRDLERDEGSLVGTLGSAENEPVWTNLSTGTYNSHITNGRTGARRLELPLVSQGAEPIDLIRRPPADESIDSLIFQQRYFSMASVRILLSDTAADITALPGVTAAPPVSLGGGGNLVVICHVVGPQAPITIQVNVNAVPAHLTHGDALGPCAGGGETVVALSSGNAADGYLTPPGTPLLGGVIKVEIQTTPGAWQDVTLEVLDLGVSGRNIDPAANCGVEPAPDAIVRLQRVRENPSQNAPCGAGSTDATDYWPNALFDPREGNYRDNVPTNQGTMPLGGVMHYVEIDVTNLSRWLDGAIGANGANALDQNGYVVYFSDRRGNRDASGQETGEYGFEDFVNPASGNGTPNGILETGEDLNDNEALDTYGQLPSGPVGLPPLDPTARPTTLVTSAVAKANPAILFRRALKLTNGDLGSIVMPGLTVAAENPVYVEGDFNAGGGAGFGEPNAATSIIADAVTLLSNAWSDFDSLAAPHDPGQRRAETTWYRVAIVSGKGLSFPRPNGPQDFGTDGGTHNFLRYLERWSGRTLNYRGSIVSFYYNRQAVGTYKCCTNVYSPPTRAYSFDVDFLDPLLLPPATPMFRDVNVLGFTQVIRPTP